MPRRIFTAAAVLLSACAFLSAQVADSFTLKLRSRTPVEGKGDEYAVGVKPATWRAARTAIIVCDVWDSHHCLNAVRREEEMVPRMNQVLEKARKMGMLIIHAPSECMAAYKDHPARKRAQQAPTAKDLPEGLNAGCRKIPSEEKGIYPIDQTDSEDDDPAEHAEWHAKLAAEGRNPRAPWKSQHAGIKIYDQDVISDSGIEIWNVLAERGINDVIMLGVHTNMCVLGRPFGLRQLVKNGKNAVLMRDMTDTMYNPKQRPFVSHYKGTELIIEHIEKFVCPSITSDQLIGGQPFRFKGDI